MNDKDLETIEELRLSRRSLLVKGGVAAAGLTAFGLPTSAAFGARAGSPIMVAVVTHGDTGWILRAGDVSAWRDGMLDALADPVRARAMAQRGRSFVEATFAPQAHLAALRAELAKAAATR